VNIDGIQSGFSPRRDTIDAIFIVRRMQEKYLLQKKELWLELVDLEKEFAKEPQAVLWWALRSSFLRSSRGIRLIEKVGEMGCGNR